MLFSFNYIPCHSFTVNKSRIDTVNNFKTKVSTIQAIEQNKDWKNVILSQVLWLYKLLIGDFRCNVGP